MCVIARVAAEHSSRDSQNFELAVTAIRRACAEKSRNPRATGFEYDSDVLLNAEKHQSKGSPVSSAQRSLWIPQRLNPQ
jgi:hypothetical protein